MRTLHLEAHNQLRKLVIRFRLQYNLPCQSLACKYPSDKQETAIELLQQAKVVGEAWAV